MHVNKPGEFSLFDLLPSFSALRSRLHSSQTSRATETRKVIAVIGIKIVSAR